MTAEHARTLADLLRYCVAEDYDVQPALRVLLTEHPDHDWLRLVLGACRTCNAVLPAHTPYLYCREHAPVPDPLPPALQRMRDAELAQVLEMLSAPSPFLSKLRPR